MGEVQITFNTNTKERKKHIQNVSIKIWKKKNTVQYLNNDRQLKISMEYLLESQLHEPISRRNTKNNQCNK